MKKYGLIGYPLQHSFSAKFFNKKFQDQEINAIYLNFEIARISQLPAIIDAHPDLKGLNVTIPYKETVIPLLDDLSPAAKTIGAVNVIKIVDTSSHYQLIGYNTDYIGFKEAILPHLNMSHPLHSHLHQPLQALVLGTGGAAKAICFALEALGVKQTLVSRSKRVGRYTYDELTPALIAAHKLIVNTTPLGTFPNIDTYPQIPYAALTAQHLLFDLVYNPSETSFLKKGKQRGASVVNGAKMLELQAMAAWNIWTTQD